MSSMKQYLNSFRVNAGLAPDDRVLSESALSEDKEINEMERKLMAALENAAKGSGKDDWSGQTAEWTEERSSGDEEDRTYSEFEVACSINLPLASVRPTVVRREDGSFATVLYVYASPKDAGKVDHNKTALSLASKEGVTDADLHEAKTGTSKRALKEGTRGPWWGVGPSMEPPDDYDEDESADYTYGEKRSWRDKLSDEGEERLMELLNERVLGEILPNLIEKTFPNMKTDYPTDFVKAGGYEPNHYGWLITYLIPKK
jgi:hypothetical protein